MTFTTFSAAVHKRYAELSKHELFTVDVSDLFETYLAAFPEGTNPMFRVRTEHDCNCCKNFIRRLGIVVSFDKSGNRLTIWDDFPELPEPYGTVARALAGIVRQAPIVGVFRTKERQYGSNPNWDNHDNSIKWEHFVGKVADKHFSTTPDKARGDRNTIAQVLRRGLEEISAADIETVLDLIEQNALYRGEEHVAAIKAFRNLKTRYAASINKDGFVWSNLDNRNARFRNTVIGTLLVDLADGVELEQAVRRFETKVAGENYKRPKALITPKMIEQAVDKLKELGLEHAVERRVARIEDVSVTDVLFVDNEVRGKMKGGLTDLLLSSSQVKAPKIGKPTPISIENFMKLGASSISLVLANDQLNRFMTVTAPQHDSTGKLFKWNNDFAWAYDGDVADSIKERVKRAGGNVDVPLRVSLAWHNSDDLDLHAECPDGTIYYGNKMGILDVDTNGLGPSNHVDPVENLSWRHPRDGVYKIDVHQFSKRNDDKVGFTIQLYANGETRTYHYPRMVANEATIPVLTFKVKNGVVTDIATQLAADDAPQDKWGIKTNTPVKVDTIMLSPNHWDGAGEVGNKHWFFILEGCKNPDEARGFFNEYLRGDLDPHRKVFEVLGSKTKCAPAADGLSGVGFSSTSKTKVIAIADGRTYEIEF